MFTKVLVHLMRYALVCMVLFNNAYTSHGGQTPGAHTKSRSIKPSKRSLPTSQPTSEINSTEHVIFDTHAFSVDQGVIPVFFLGSQNSITSSDLKKYALSRAQIATNVDAQRTTVELIPLADQTDSGNSPLQGMAIGSMALLNNILPVVTLQDATANNVPGKIIYLVTAPLDGSAVINNTQAINDANGQPTPSTRGLAARTTQVFTAVPAQNASFGSFLGQTGGIATSDGTNRGIAVLQYDAVQDTLTPVNTDDISNINNAANVVAKAALMDVQADSNPFIAFTNPADSPNTITGALIGDDVALWWDEDLDRLYIGLSEVHRDDPNQSGGIANLLMGLFGQTNASSPLMFAVKPLVNGINTSLFEKNKNDHLVGYYATTQEDVLQSTRLLRTMHTSTGKYYLIAQVITSPPPLATNNVLISRTRNWVYALPLCEPSTITSPLTGTLAKVSGADGTPQSTLPVDINIPKTVNDMPRESHSAARVGRPTDGPFGPWLEGTWLDDLYVQGDSVYAAYAGPDNQHAGLFASTALFNANGFIRAWTPWQRVGGEVRRAHAVGVDPNTADLYQLCPKAVSDPAALFDYTTVRTTDWGPSDLVFPADDPHNISDVFEKIFTVDTCPAYRIACFDEFTPGFVPQQFAMMVAVGGSNLVILQTGNFARGGLQPSAIYTFDQTANMPQNAVTYVNLSEQGQAGEALVTIAPLTCAEVDRTTMATGGWLFVGGRKGLAVLCKTDGTGWDAQAGLADLDLDNNKWPSLSFTFKQINPIGNTFGSVKALRAVNGFLFVLTDTKLYRIKLAGLETALAGSSPRTIPATNVNLVATAQKNQIFVDLVTPSNVDNTNCKWGALATTTGLFTVDMTSGQLTEVKINNTDSLGLVVGLQYFSQEHGHSSTRGNLYALQADFVHGTSALFRFDVDGGNSNRLLVINPIKRADGSQGPILELDRYRHDFFADGSFILHALSQDLGFQDYLDLVSMPAHNPPQSKDITPLLGIDASQQRIIGSLAREGAFGAWLVPGTWGLRVNQ